MLASTFCHLSVCFATLSVSDALRAFSIRTLVAARQGELNDGLLRAMVQGREDVVGLDSAVILAPQVWKASGHLDTFTDPLTECLSCHKRFREDQLIESFAHILRKFVSYE